MGIGLEGYQKLALLAQDMGMGLVKHRRGHRRSGRGRFCRGFY